MYKKSLFGLSLLAITSAGHTMSFNTPISKLNLPVMLSTEPPPPVKYFPPSTINVSAVRTCGDGDVVHFAGNHPNFEYVPSDATQFDVIMGYWIVEENATNIMPTEGNWFPIAYKKVPIATSESNRIYEGHFHPINHASTPNTTNVMTLIRSELLHLYQLSTQSFERSKNYRVFSAAFGCANPDGAEDLDQGKAFAPSPVQILRSLEKLKVEVEDFNLDNINSNKIKITTKLAQDSQLFGGPTTQPSPFSFELSSSGDVELSGAAYEMFKAILGASYPAGQDYQGEMNQLSFKDRLDNFIGTDKIDYCNAMGLKSHKTLKSYDNLEAFPMNLSCKNLFQGNSLLEKYNALFSATRPDTLDKFNTAKKDLARLFLTAAAFTAVQNELNKTSRSTAGCHPKINNGQNYVERLNSFPFKLSKPNGSPIYKFEASGPVQHPEYLFAINQYTRYYSHPVLGIWGQVTNVLQAPTSPQVYRDGQSMLLPNTPAPVDELTLESFSGSPININFKTRSVGGGCVGIPTC
jgi:hypothetical protein